MCHPPTTEDNFIEIVTSFNLLIADPSSLTAAQINTLDYYNDGVVGYDDRDYWLDQMIRRNITVTDRLSFSDSTPMTKAQSDPLGLTTGRSYALIIDSLNDFSAGGVGVYVNESDTNLCYTNEGRTSLATHGTGGSSQLFTGASAITYNYDVFRDIRSIFRGDTGDVNRRRFPDTPVEVTVYIRGGDYTYDREGTFINEDASGSPTPDTNPTRIVIRNYPGEVVNIYCGNSTGSTAAMVTVSRPDMKFRGINFYCYRTSGSDRIFAPYLFNITNAGDRCEISDSTISFCRAIAPTHDDAGRLPHYVDSAYTGRTLSAQQTTAKLLTYTAIQIGLNNNGTLLQDLTITPAGDDFPRSVTVPGGSTEYDFGDTIDIAGTASTTMRRVTVDGVSSHQCVQTRDSSGTETTGLLIEYCDFSNPENTCIGFTCETSICRYNRIHDFGTRDGAQDGNGIQVLHGDGNEIYGNVIWNNDAQASGQNFGIDIGVSQSDSTKEFVNNTIRNNILYLCGMSFGYSQSPPAVAPGRVHDNSIDDNIFYGLSDFSLTDAAYNAPISTILGPNVASFYDNTFDGNSFFRYDGDKTALVERLPSPADPTDWNVTDHGTWFVNNTYANPQFVDPEGGDFNVDSSSAVSSLIVDNTPLDNDSLAPVFCYTCPTEFSTATFDYTLKHKQGRLDLGMPAQAKALLGGTP